MLFSENLCDISTLSWFPLLDCSRVLNHLWVRRVFMDRMCTRSKNDCWGNEMIIVQIIVAWAKSWHLCNEWALRQWLNDRSFKGILYNGGAFLDSLDARNEPMLCCCDVVCLVWENVKNWGCTHVTQESVNMYINKKHLSVSGTLMVRPLSLYIEV